MRNTLWAGAVVLAALTFALGSRAGTEGTERPLDTPLAVYSAACSSCHGDDGRGRSRERVGFDVELPDFTECTFATRAPGIPLSVSAWDPRYLAFQVGCS